MAETHYFLNLVKARLNLPLPEPERTEALEYFNFVDFGESEFYHLWNEKYLTAEQHVRFREVTRLRNKYVCSGRYEYYLETEDDGSKDSMIQRCISTLSDKDSFCLNDRQRKIAMDLIELRLLNEESRVWDEYRKRHIYSIRFSDLRCGLSASEFEIMLKWRYLSMKYGRQKRLAEEMREKKARQRRIDAACLGGGFSIDW